MNRKEPSFKYNYAMLLDDNDLDNFINQKTMEAIHFSKKIYVNSGSKSALEFLLNINSTYDDTLSIFPEVIFVDINMPMIDGFQFLENLQKSFPEKFSTLKIVILTSSLSEEDRVKAATFAKDILFLNKPLTTEELSKI